MVSMASDRLTGKTGHGDVVGTVDGGDDTVRRDGGGKRSQGESSESIHVYWILVKDRLAKVMRVINECENEMRPAQEWK